MKFTTRMLFLILALAAPGNVPESQAQTDASLTILHSFGLEDEFQVNPDGVHPQAGLTQGNDGNFYGTAYTGGVNGTGTVFRITPAGAFTLFHVFSAAPQNRNADGAYPHSGLLLGSDGNLYGTTVNGGSQAVGVVYRLDPAGELTVLHTFNVNGQDGTQPQGNLIQGQDGNFYGTTSAGGAGQTGTVFRVSPAGDYTVLHAFAPVDSGRGNSEGAAPLDTLVQASDGNFYGTTSSGGDNSAGTLFRMTPEGVFTVLRSFDYTDGTEPKAGLVEGFDGNLYGTTPYAGAGDAGTAFRITLAGGFTLLRAFMGEASIVYASLIRGSDGNLYGTAFAGGNGGGTLFRLSPDGSATAVYDFDGTNNGATSPIGGILEGHDGNLYGTTAGGGTEGNGTVFRFTAGLPLSTIPVPLPIPPAATLTATIPSVAAGSGEDGLFTLSLEEPPASDVVVNLLIKGSAVNGTDYALIKSFKKIKAGTTTKTIKISPLGAGPGPGEKRTVVIELAAGSGYTVGTVGKVKVEISGR